MIYIMIYIMTHIMFHIMIIIRQELGGNLTMIMNTNDSMGTFMSIVLGDSQGGLTSSDVICLNNRTLPVASGGR